MGGERFREAFESLGKSLDEKSSPSEEIKLLNVSIKSMESLSQMKNTAENVDIWVALLASLETKLTFVKSDLTRNLIESILSKSANLNKVSGMLKMFDHFNLRLKCESASILSNFDN